MAGFHIPPAVLNTISVHRYNIGEYEWDEMWRVRRIQRARMSKQGFKSIA